MNRHSDATVSAQRIVMRVKGAWHTRNLRQHGLHQRRAAAALLWGWRLPVGRRAGRPSGRTTAATASADVQLLVAALQVPDAAVGPRPLRGAPAAAVLLQRRRALLGGAGAGMWVPGGVPVRGAAAQRGRMLPPGLPRVRWQLPVGAGGQQARQLRRLVLLEALLIRNLRGRPSRPVACKLRTLHGRLRQHSSADIRLRTRNSA